jgi:hypothetical protein
MYGFTLKFRLMFSWRGEQELLHFHISYKSLELLCLARPKDVTVFRLMSLKGTVGVCGCYSIGTVALFPQDVSGCIYFA